MYYDHFLKTYRKKLNYLICKRNISIHTKIDIHIHTLVWDEYTKLLSYSYDLTKFRLE